MPSLKFALDLATDCDLEFVPEFGPCLPRDLAWICHQTRSETHLKTERSNSDI